MKVYIFGHKKPDTDSVCSAIAYSYLKNKLGLNAEARVLGDINKETKFVLDYFNVKEPRYLDDVKVQIKNMNYLKGAYVNEHSSILDSFNKIHDINSTGIPVIDDNDNLVGYVNLKDISKYIIDGDIYNLKTTYDNIVNTLKGVSLLKFDEEISGNVLAAAFRSEHFIDSINLSNNDILIVADREKILRYAIESKVKLIIIVGNNKIPFDLFNLAKENKVNIIVSPYTTYKLSNKLKLCNYISVVEMNKEPICFSTSEFRDDFLDVSSKIGHTNYPVLDINNKCIGMLRLVDQNNYSKYNVILVDHNQMIQSVDGIEEANIIEIVDHHNLGTIGTNSPISFRAMPVGCTSTIIYHIYKENNVDIPKDMAGIMLSAIISDTLILKSPTTTQLDIEAANNLANLCDIDIKSYGYSMFKNGSSIKNMSVKEIFEQDFKTYKLDDFNFGISQVMTLDIDSIMDNKQEFIDLLNDMNDNYSYKVSLMFVTDIIKNGSYIFYNEKAKDILEIVYGIKEISEGYFIKGMVSRKKQMVPELMEYLQK